MNRSQRWEPSAILWTCPQCNYVNKAFLRLDKERTLVDSCEGCETRFVVDVLPITKVSLVQDQPIEQPWPVEVQK